MCTLKNSKTKQIFVSKKNVLPGGVAEPEAEATGLSTIIDVWHRLFEVGQEQNRQTSRKLQVPEGQVRYCDNDVEYFKKNNDFIIHADLFIFHVTREFNCVRNHDLLMFYLILLQKCTSSCTSHICYCSGIFSRRILCASVGKMSSCPAR